MLQEGCKLVTNCIGFLTSSLNFSVNSAIFSEDTTEVLEFPDLPQLGLIDGHIQFPGKHKVFNNANITWRSNLEEKHKVFNITKYHLGRIIHYIGKHKVFNNANITWRGNLLEKHKVFNNARIIWMVSLLEKPKVFNIITRRDTLLHW